MEKHPPLSYPGVFDSGPFKNHLPKVFFALLTSTLLLTVACEDKKENPITVTPDSITLQTGQSWGFAASGGSDYRWSLKYEDTAKVVPRTGPQVTFTSTGIGTLPAVEQILTVSCLAPDGTPASAEAFITQVPIGGAPATGGSSTNSGGNNNNNNSQTDHYDEMWLTVSGSSFTVHHLWSDGSEFTKSLADQVGTTSGSTTADGTSEDHTVSWSGVTWSGSNITAITVVIDGVKTLDWDSGPPPPG